MTREQQIYRVTLVGSAVNAALVAFKFVAGLIGHSSAMVADAVHSLSDFLTDIIVLLMVKLSSRPRDDDHDYGHGKYEAVATALIGVALSVVAVSIIVKGARSIALWLGGDTLPAPGYLAFWAALVSIVSKELLYRYTIRIGRKIDSQAVIANAWHHRSDALSSLGTGLGIAGAVLLGSKWTVLDPLASVIVGAVIVRVAVGLLKPSIKELTDSSLSKETEDEIIRIVKESPEVSEPHKLCTRRIGKTYSIEMHLRMDGRMSLFDSHNISKQIEKRLKARFGGDAHVILHVEPVKKSIRRSTEPDIPRIMEIFDEARARMRAEGNMHQWTNGYPGQDIIMNDISNGNSYVMEEEGRIIATFAFILGKDPTYDVIEGGQWLDADSPYGTIHRIAACDGVSGVSYTCFHWCSERIDNLRVDTHTDNITMKHAILAAGFKYCGVIHLLNGDPRDAYQRILNRDNKK